MTTSAPILSRFFVGGKGPFAVEAIGRQSLVILPAYLFGTLIWLGVVAILSVVASIISPRSTSCLGLREDLAYELRVGDRWWVDQMNKWLIGVPVVTVPGAGDWDRRGRGLVSSLASV